MRAPRGTFARDPPRDGSVRTTLATLALAVTSAARAWRWTSADGLATWQTAARSPPAGVRGTAIGVPPARGPVTTGRGGERSCARTEPGGFCAESGGLPDPTRFVRTRVTSTRGDAPGPARCGTCRSSRSTATGRTASLRTAAACTSRPDPQAAWAPFRDPPSPFSKGGCLPVDRRTGAARADLGATLNLSIADGWRQGG